MQGCVTISERYGLTVSGFTQKGVRKKEKGLKGKKKKAGKKEGRWNTTEEGREIQKEREGGRTGEEF